MIKVRLLTSHGGYVVEGEILPFHPNPEVLLWGTRIFKHDATDTVCVKLTEGDDSPIVYRECFAVALLNTELNKEVA